jgi:hypothetical protein
VAKTQLYVTNGQIIAWDSSLNVSTNYPIRRPTLANSFWQHNTNGTSQYVTPGAMVVTNPAGGTNTIQASLDSLNANGADGNGIYGGSGSVPNGTTAATLGTFTLGNSLGNHLYIENGNEAALYSDLSRVSVKDSVTISSAGSDGAAGQVLIGTAGDGSYWGNAASLPVINPFGGVNTIQASLDSIGSGDNGIFSAANNNDTIRVTTSTLKNNWTINSNNKILTLAMNATANTGSPTALRITTPFISGADIYSLMNLNSFSVLERALTSEFVSTKELLLGGMNSNSNYSFIKLTSTGDTEFRGPAGARLKLNDAALTSSLTLATPVVPIAYTLTLPPNDGDAGQFLQTNGSGITSWVSSNSGGGVATISEDTPFAYSSSILLYKCVIQIILYYKVQFQQLAVLAVLLIL